MMSWTTYELMSRVAQLPTFVQSLKSLILKTGDTATLKCIVTGLPEPTSTW